jgi:hypothetical protein
MPTNRRKFVYGVRNQALPTGPKFMHVARMAARRELDRSTIEAWSAIIIGVIAAAIPMTWQLECGLLAVAFLLVCDLIFHARIANEIWWPFRLILCVYALVVLAAIGLPSVDQRLVLASGDKRPPPHLMAVGRLLGDVEHPVPLVLLLASVPVMVLWRKPSVWRFRHQLISAWRVTLDGAVWIDHTAAIQTVKNSRFGNYRWNKSAPARDRGLGILAAAIFQYDPKVESRNQLFYDWCETVLNRFSGEDSRRIRITDDNTEYNEASLNKYLEGRYESDLISTFGDP